MTALVGHLLRSAGMDCEVAGNIAPPVLQAYRNGCFGKGAARLGARAVELPARDHLVARAARRRDAQPDRGPPRPLREPGRLWSGEGTRLPGRRRASPQPRRSAVTGDGAARQKGRHLRARRAAAATTSASPETSWSRAQRDRARSTSSPSAARTTSPTRSRPARWFPRWDIPWQPGRRVEELQGPAAPAGAGRHAPRRRVVRRLQGHQRRRDRRRVARPWQEGGPDSRRRGQGAGFCPARGRRFRAHALATCSSSAATRR